MPRPACKIFVSHASADNALAQVIVDYLSETLTIHDVKEILCTSLPGHEVPPGANHKQFLRNAIREASIVIGLLTPKAVERQAVMMELGAAWALEKEFMPLLYGVGFERIPEWVQAQAVRLDHSIDDFKLLNKRATPIVEAAAEQTGYPMKGVSPVGDANHKLFEALTALLTTISPPSDAAPAPVLNPTLAGIVRRAKTMAASLRASEGKKSSLPLASLVNIQSYNAWLEEAKAAGSTLTVAPLEVTQGFMPGLAQLPMADFISALEVLATEVELSPVKALSPTNPLPVSKDPDAV